MSSKAKKEALEWGKALVEAIVILMVLKFVLRTPVPIAAVASGSMLPTLERGDLVVVHGVSPTDIRIGNIVVYRSCQGPYIIHRVVGVVLETVMPNGSTIYEFAFTNARLKELLKKVNNSPYNIYFITKGDNNALTDLALGQFVNCTTGEPLPGVPAKRVVGAVVEVGGIPLKVPYLGYVALLAFPFLWWLPH